jgi:hypothetical protein
MDCEIATRKRVVSGALKIPLLGAGVLLLFMVGHCAYLVWPVHSPDSVEVRATVSLDDSGGANVCLMMRNSAARTVCVFSASGYIDDTCYPSLLDVTPEWETLCIIAHEENGACCYMNDSPIVANLAPGDHTLYFVVDGHETNKIRFRIEPTGKLVILEPTETGTRSSRLGIASTAV